MSSSGGLLQPVAIQPLATPSASQVAVQSGQTPQQQFEMLLNQMRNLMRPTDQNDPLAPVGVTPQRTQASGGSSSSSSSSSNSSQMSGGDRLMQLLTGKTLQGKDTGDSPSGGSHDKLGALSNMIDVLNGKASKDPSGKTGGKLGHLVALLSLL